MTISTDVGIPTIDYYVIFSFILLCDVVSNFKNQLLCYSVRNQWIQFHGHVTIIVYF